MLRILHLSDLHFGKMRSTSSGGKSASAHRFARDDEPLPEVLADILLRNVDPPPDLVIVSGDVGWSGSREDYDYARKFFQILRGKWSAAAIVIAPGNHDVDCDRGNDKQDEFLAFLRDVHTGNFGDQYPLLKVAPTVDRQTIIAVHLVTSTTSRSNDVLVVAVNSAAHIEATHGKPVFITPAALLAIEDKIHEMKIREGALRIFVLHHHLFPFAERDWQNATDPMAVKEALDSTLTWNSAKLQGWLAQHSFRVVLHGHKHLSHGRKDVLWRTGDKAPDGRGIFVIGAGSAGVEDGHREHGEPLSYNIISVARLSKERWNVDVSVCQIEERLAVPRVESLYSYRSAVGHAPLGMPRFFQAERMDDCHRTIHDACRDRGVIPSFVSVVEDPTYVHPSTARIGADEAKEEKVRSSFLTLHPEYDNKDGWTDMSKVEDRLQANRHRFHFQHGPRLFGRKADETRPLVRAVENIKQGSGSRAYVSLFDPGIDILSRDEPLPGLMSIQFVKQPPFLDVVATFRKLELSFWWVVNMYELGKLLKWAEFKIRSEKLTARRITFFAALAEWSPDPEPAFVTRLDSMPLHEMAALVLGAYNAAAHGASKRDELKVLLAEKRAHTSDTNLDATGLKTLAELIEGLKSGAPGTAQKSLSNDVASKVAEAAAHIRNAMKSTRDDRQTSTDRAREALDQAIRLL
jgi:3',5'-cyclic AMP phosphodiesterase CpdA